ncbi:TPA: hypothetical protein MDD12_005097 [Klebsiella aerogenes]|nr:hypothetical protein [Klebsiella aerogenes]
MKKPRDIEEQHAENYPRVGKVSRKMSISKPSFYNWKKKFTGPGITELRQLGGGKSVAKETNGRAESGQGDTEAKVPRSARKRQTMHFLRKVYRISLRRRCKLLMQSRTVYHWKSRQDERTIILRIREPHPLRSPTQACQYSILSATTDPDRYRSVLEFEFNVENLFNGQHFRTLTVGNHFSRECLAIHAVKAPKGEDTVSVMEGLRVMGKRLSVGI